jgi:transposase
MNVGGDAAAPEDGRLALHRRPLSDEDGRAWYPVAWWEVTGNVAMTCRYYGISRQAYYIWYRRYLAEGIGGLRTRSKRPKSSPNATHVEVVGKILHLRQHYHFGPEKIAMYLKRYHDLDISKSGVWRILKRLNISRLPTSQRYQRHDRRWKRYEKQRPGHHVQIDVKFIEPLAGTTGRRGDGAGHPGRPFPARPGRAAGRRQFCFRCAPSCASGTAAGDLWEQRLHERLRWADAVVCVVSAAYVASAWCAAEVGIASARGSRLLPLYAEPGVAHPLLSALQYTDLGDRDVAHDLLREALARLDAAGGRGGRMGGGRFRGCDRSTPTCTGCSSAGAGRCRSWWVCCGHRRRRPTRG